jgi:EAL domain-containing protein (putative c-di-GMP-specific phosphodiesterase class I)
VKLRPTARPRRYDVLTRASGEDSRSPAAQDASALQQLLGWLGTHRAAWSLEPTSFTLNLSIATLEDERFLKEVTNALRANSVAAESIGFEIAETLCTQRRVQVERFIASCERLGCFVAIDDFSFDSSILPLLRSRAVRLVKIDRKLTATAEKDKLSQGIVTAIVQAVKVLGMHCAAKGVESQSCLKWLTSAGIDLAQGPVLAQPLRLESMMS